ncbi:MAG: ABC transporter substrate binding protein, partial [Pseudolabrys sp.]
VILAMSSPALVSLLQATRTVPIVFVGVADPAGAGFVDSLSRPGGNATGFMLFDYSLSTKWVELLKEIAPGGETSGGPSGSRNSLRDRPVGRDQFRGAGARRGGEPGQCARRA